MKTAIRIIIALYTIAGGIIGYVSMKNLKFRRLLKRDCKNIERYLCNLAENCINTVSLEDLENWEDDRKPIKPIPIYLYD
jgi:hypothetical protein